MIGDMIKKLRSEKSLTQSQLAEKLGVGAGSTLRMWELNKSQPSIEMICKIADYFDVTTDYLLGQTQFRTARDQFLNECSDWLGEAHDLESRTQIYDAMIAEMAAGIKIELSAAEDATLMATIINVFRLTIRNAGVFQDTLSKKIANFGKPVFDQSVFIETVRHMDIVYEPIKLAIVKWVYSNRGMFLSEVESIGKSKVKRYSPPVTESLLNDLLEPKKIHDTDADDGK